MLRDTDLTPSVPTQNVGTRWSCTKQEEKQKYEKGAVYCIHCHGVKQGNIRIWRRTAPLWCCICAWFAENMAGPSTICGVLPSCETCVELGTGCGWGAAKPCDRACLRARRALHSKALSPHGLRRGALRGPAPAPNRRPCHDIAVGSWHGRMRHLSVGTDVGPQVRHRSDVAHDGKRAIRGASPDPRGIELSHALRAHCVTHGAVRGGVHARES